MSAADRDRLKLYRRALVQIHGREGLPPEVYTLIENAVKGDPKVTGQTVTARDIFEGIMADAESEWKEDTP